MGRAQTLDDLGGTVVAVRGGVPVLLGDVATLRDGPAPRRGVASREGREVVSCRVVKQFGADTVAVASGARRALEELQRTLPPGVNLRLVYDQPDLVRTSLGGVGRAVAIGAVLVAIVLLWLLGHPRAALLVAIPIPLSIAMAGLDLRLAGIGLNTMTLGGLAIAVGLLVDASIIMVDNIAHRMATAPPGAGRSAVALQAATEVGRPIAFATAIVMAVFLPLLAMQGIEGLLYRPLALAVLAAVGSSLVLALVLVPLMAAALLPPGAGGGDHDAAPIRAIKRLYAPLLDLCLRRAGLVRLLTLVSYNFLFFLAGMQSIPKSLIEAAAIDGAGPARRFFTIVFPLLSPTTFFLLVVNIVFAFFNTFAIIDAATGGGPGQATEILVYKIYKDGFKALDLGSSAVQSVVLMAIVIGLTVLQFKWIERKVQY